MDNKTEVPDVEAFIADHTEDQEGVFQLDDADDIRTLAAQYQKVIDEQTGILASAHEEYALCRKLLMERAEVLLAATEAEWHELMVGHFGLSKGIAPERIWIRSWPGPEGGDFKTADLEALIGQFYSDNF